MPAKLHTDVARASHSQLKHAFTCLHVPHKQMLLHVTALLNYFNLEPQKDCSIPAHFPRCRIYLQDNSIAKQPCCNDPELKEAAE